MVDSYPFKQIFWQTWRDLIFVHWEVDPACIEPLLPPLLEPETFNGKAYIGLVPFRMTDIRSVWFPPIPGTSSTLETNVRTYVKRRDVHGEPVPAVWFFSLEAHSALAVIIARLKYGLPYFRATMTFLKTTSDGIYDRFCAESFRRWPQPTPARALIDAEFSPQSPYVQATPGTLEHFLIERYALYAQKHNRLTYARVHHEPYRFRQGILRGVDPGVLIAAGLPAPTSTESLLVHHAQDVMVRVAAPISL